jgi:hypothetical protein
MKTEKLLDHYMSQFNEQDEQGSEEMSASKRYIIKILVNAFLFNITKFPQDQQERINDNIEGVQRSVNEPISALVRRIKNIINMDRSLAVESTTLKMIAHYIRENTLDATEPQARDRENASDKPVGNLATANDNQGDDVDININLAEAFPAYRDLIISALKYTPTEDEGRMVEAAVSEAGELEPTLVVDTISGILDSSQSDVGVRDELATL